jgi:hypothetical protein
MSYIIFPETDDPEINQLYIDFLKDMKKENEIDKKVIPILIVLAAIGLSIFPIMMILAFILAN